MAAAAHAFAQITRERPDIEPGRHGHPKVHEVATARQEFEVPHRDGRSLEGHPHVLPSEVVGFVAVNFLGGVLGRHLFVRPAKRFEGDLQLFWCRQGAHRRLIQPGPVRIVRGRCPTQANGRLVHFVVPGQKRRETSALAEQHDEQTRCPRIERAGVSDASLAGDLA